MVMADEKEKVFETEDIPSDFFDDIMTEDFMEGLSVIDSWDDDDSSKKRQRFNAETLDSVSDLREVIDDKTAEYDCQSRATRKNRQEEHKKPYQRYSRDQYRSGSRSHLDEYIKTGSRRDPRKTKEAIRKDKEVKVKQYLNKHLESSNEVCPPGTELDDFFDEKKSVKKRFEAEYRSIKEQINRRNRSRSRGHRHKSPSHYVAGEWWSPKHHSPHHRTSFSRYKNFHSSHQYSSHHHSPVNHSRTYRSPPRYRKSPQKQNPHRYHRSRSPRTRSYESEHSRSHSPKRDTFLYPPNYEVPTQSNSSSNPYQEIAPEYTASISDYSCGTPGFPFSQEPTYTSGYSGTYEYTQSGLPGLPQFPEPIPSTPQPVPAPILPPTVSLSIVSTAISAPVSSSDQKAVTPYDALAQLVAEGKISHEDYLKLAPGKGAVNFMDSKARVMVLNRCQEALHQLSSLVLPNRLIMNNSILGPELKCLPSKYSSPLKRQESVEFNFTKTNDKAQQTKKLVDSIISAVGLSNIISRPKKKVQKNMKDVAVQTVKPFCDVCEIRSATERLDRSTSIDHQHFSTSAHSQVVEQDLVNSKTVFNVSGGVGDAAPISIAHLTPAQLVSQLAARAKTLKQSEPAPLSNQYSRRNPHNNYDYDPRGAGPQYHNYRY